MTRFARFTCDIYLAFRLTATRPNSQARSSGVFPAVSEMHVLDWCCSNISDCRHTKKKKKKRCIINVTLRQSKTYARRGPDEERKKKKKKKRPEDAAGYPVIVSVLSRQVERDLSFVRLSVDGRACLQQHFQWFSLALPGGVVQRTHPCINKSDTLKRTDARKTSSSNLT